MTAYLIQGAARYGEDRTDLLIDGGLITATGSDAVAAAPGDAVRIDAAGLIARLKTQAAEGVGVVLVLHDLAMAMNHADRVLVLEKGRLTFDGEVDAGIRHLHDDEPLDAGKAGQEELDAELGSDV